MKTSTRHTFAAALFAVLSLLLGGCGVTQDKKDGVVDLFIRFSATDGTPLEGKLSLPAGAKGQVPVVFRLHGAGPRTLTTQFNIRTLAASSVFTGITTFFPMNLRVEASPSFGSASAAARATPRGGQRLIAASSPRPPRAYCLTTTQRPSTPCASERRLTRTALSFLGLAKVHASRPG